MLTSKVHIRYIIRSVTLLISLLPFLTLFLPYFSGIPFRDDYAMFPVLLNQGDYSFFIQPHNQHQIIMHKLSVWTTYTLFSSEYIGMLLRFNILFFSAVLLFISKKIWSTQFIYQAIFASLVFSPSLYENASWALCSSQHLVIFAFVWLSLHLLTSSNSWVELSAGYILGIFGYLSSGNGLLIWLILAVIMLYRQLYGLLFIWTVSLIFILVYFPNTTQVNPLTSFRLPHLKSLVWLISGGYGFIQNTFVLKCIFGLFSILQMLFMRTIWKNRQNLPQIYLLLLGIQLFCLGTFVGLSMYRDISYQTIPDRYRIYILFYWSTFWIQYYPKLIAVRATLLILIFLANVVELERCRWNAAVMYWEKKLSYLNALHHCIIPDTHYGPHFSSLYFKLTSLTPIPGVLPRNSSYLSLPIDHFLFQETWSITPYKNKITNHLFYKVTSPNLPANLTTTLDESWLRLDP